MAADTPTPKPFYSFPQNTPNALRRLRAAATMQLYAPNTKQSETCEARESHPSLHTYTHFYQSITNSLSLSWPKRNYRFVRRGRHYQKCWVVVARGRRGFPVVTPKKINQAGGASHDSRLRTIPSDDFPLVSSGTGSQGDVLLQLHVV